MASSVEYRKKSNSLDDISTPRALSVIGPPRSVSSYEPSQNEPHHKDSRDIYGSLDTGSPIHFLVNSLMNNTKWHSDTQIASNQMVSRLLVDKTELFVNTAQQVTIHWDIKENVSAKDWIGLYRINQTHPGKWLDYRSRGVSGSKNGELVWNFDRISSTFTEAENRVCFRYYHGNTGDLRAASESILVRNIGVSPTPAVGRLKRIYSVTSDADIIHLAIQDIEVAHVRKGMFFNPDPYVKMRIEPGKDGPHLVASHHYKETRTSICENTTEPCWRNEIFHFMTLSYDALSMKVKDRFSSSRPTLLRFLGHVHIPIKDVVERAKMGLTVSHPLVGRSPHDHICGTLSFKPTLIPYDADRVLLNGGESYDDNVIGSPSEPSYSGSTPQTFNTSLSSSDEESASHLTGGAESNTRRQTAGSDRDSGDISPFQHGGAEATATLLSSDTEDAIEPGLTESVLSLLSSTLSDDSQVLVDGRTVGVSDDVSNMLFDPPPLYNHQEPSSPVDSLPDPMQASNPQNISCEHGCPDATESTQTGPVLDISSNAQSEEVDGERCEAASHMDKEYQGQLTNAKSGEEPGEPQSGVSVIQRHVDTSEQVDLAPCAGAEVTGDRQASGDSEVEQHHPLPEDDGSPGGITADVSTGSADSLRLEGVAEVRDNRDCEAFVDKEHPSPNADRSSTTECLSASSLGSGTLLVPHDARSTSAWSLENHAGSRENIFDGVESSTTGALVDDISTYMNASAVLSNPTTPDPESFAKEKKPLPQPRIKTLAEQLNNLQVIESEVATGYQFHHTSKPPNLPVKVKDVAASSHPKLQRSQQLPTSTKSLKDVRTGHNKQYGIPDVVDAKPKHPPLPPPIPPPQLKPRMLHSTAPQLPPRRQKADGSIVAALDNTNTNLEEVFEPSHNATKHNRDRKSRSRPTVSAESEEANVASEVANAAASLPRAHRMKSESIEVEEALPAGWEARVDAHGRVFYIDHHNKITTWTRPHNEKPGQTSPHQTLQRIPSISNTDRRNMDHRYRNIQRMASVDVINEISLSPPLHQAPPPPPGIPRPLSTETPPPVVPRPAATLDPSDGPGNEAVASSSAPADAPKAVTTEMSADNRLQQEIIRNSPAIKFLTRTDFFSLVQYSDEAQVAYTSNSALKHMVHKIRKDPMTFHKYWHNKDLVNFLNIFVNKDEELPGNWQMKHDKTGKVFFLDHSTKTTTFIDPRLPILQPELHQGYQIPLPQRKYVPTPEDDDSLPTAYNEKVVMFLRQPNILQVLQDKYPLLKKNESLRTKVNTIISDGTLALKRYRNHVELTILLSMFENEIMSFTPAYLRQSHEESHQQASPKGSPALGRRHAAPPYKRDFQEKYRAFLRKLETKGVGQGPGKIKMRVRRDHILEDSFKKVMSYSKKDLAKHKLLISFLGEEGLDYGGPAREFFFLLSRELFNPYYGLFEYSANDTYTVQISTMSAFVDDAAEWFRFAGRMIGLCIVHQFLMDSFFTRPFYKMLLRESCVLSDLESLDAEFHQSLLWIKDNDISEAGLDLTFSVDEEVFGQVIERELKPNGVNIPVTNKNKKEYTEKMVSWRIERGVNEQKDHLLRGFYEVIEPKLVSIFDAKDLELVIAGTAEIDIVDWRNNTEYRSGYYDTHPVIGWFWEVIKSFDNEQRLRLLQFVTGTSSIPFEGFAALRGSNGPRKFTIEKWGTSESLPRAHTCFNRLDLPTYTAKETMQEKLLLAISETSTFGIE